MSLFLQIFLALNVLAIGAVGTIAIQHALEHFRPKRKDTKSIPPELYERLLLESQLRFESVIEKISQSLEYDLEAASADITQKLNNLGSGVDTASTLLNKLLQNLGNDLETTSSGIKSKIDQLGQDMESASSKLLNQLEQDGSDVIKNEMKLYQDRLKQLHEQAETSIGDFQKEIKGFQDELQSKLQQHADSQKQLLNQQIETKLNNAVMSFLLETLQHNVDLGAQEKYLKDMLEQHKSELKQEVSGGTKAAK